MSGKKWGFLSPANVPEYKGELPVILLTDSDAPYWYVVSFWYRLMSNDEQMICSAEGYSLRLAKKKAFKRYREVCNEAG